MDKRTFAAFLASLGLPAFRVRQVWRWIYRDCTADFAAMTDLPRALRDDLSARASLSRPVVEARRDSADALTTKVLFALHDGLSVETVLMRYPPVRGTRARSTVCVSSQVGCPVGCAFCATGRQRFERNLSAGEIVSQVLHFAGAGWQGQGHPITNIVFMGQGEPLLNFPAVWQAVEALNDPDGFNLGARHMTISTAGVVPGIRALAAKSLQVGLAVSLHAADDDLRTTLVPLNRRYPLAAVLEACREYATRTGRRVTFEYALIDRVNDSLRQARRLAALLAGQLAHVNLLPLNEIQTSSWRPSPRDRVRGFQAELEARGIPTSVRVSRGEEILAACGQLRGRHQGPGGPYQSSSPASGAAAGSAKANVVP